MSLIIHYTLERCALGYILVAKNNHGVCAIMLGDEPQTLLSNLQNQFANTMLMAAGKEREDLVAQVISYVDNPEKKPTLSLDIQGTDFQKRVWAQLQKIPFGSTATYSDIANRIGLPKAFRAVANACAANKLAIVIPCHRVIRTDGSRSGYRWGEQRKRLLLEKEQKQKWSST